MKDSVCLSIVVGEEGIPQNVLIRAVEPIDGWDYIKNNRKGKIKNCDNKKKRIRLSNAPGKMGQVFG